MPENSMTNAGNTSSSGATPANTANTANTNNNDSSGCILLFVFVAVIVAIIYFSSIYQATPVDIQGNCATSVEGMPLKFVPFSAYDSWNKVGDFLNDTNAFPRTPETAIHRVLVAIQERHLSHYKMSFEESTEFNDQKRGSGMSGKFANVQISVIAQDEQIAIVQVAATWIPSRIETVYENTSLFYCQQLTLVNARKAIGTSKLRVNISGWFLRDDQTELIPYNFSRLYSHLIELNPPTITPTVIP